MPAGRKVLRLSEVAFERTCFIISWTNFGNKAWKARLDIKKRKTPAPAALLQVELLHPCRRKKRGTDFVKIKFGRLETTQFVRVESPTSIIKDKNVLKVGENKL